MSYYKFYKSVPIDVCGKGKHLGPEWFLGIWEYSENKPIWGLMHFNEPTNMCYDLDYAKPQDAIKKLEARTHQANTPTGVAENTDTDWYFDVGYKIVVKKEDLEQAFKDLGIWDSNGLP